MTDIFRRTGNSCVVVMKERTSRIEINNAEAHTKQRVLTGNARQDLKKYNYLYLEQAIEFADLIFNDNLNKIYFLRQYIKDGNVTSKPFVKSRSFTSR